MSALNQRELATVLAALRLWQGLQLGRRGVTGNMIQEIATDDGTLQALTIPEIDDLCERLNGVGTENEGKLWAIRRETFRPAGQPERLRRIVILEGKRLVAVMDGPFGDTEKFVVRNFEAIVRDHNSKNGGAS